MQLTHLDADQAADVLAESRTITAIDWHGMRAHIMTSDTGRDFLLVQCDATGGAVQIDGCEHDADSGGSAHDHARAILVDEPAAA